MDWMATTISRSTSGAKVKLMEFAVNLDVSYPPKMSCAGWPFLSSARFVRELDDLGGEASYGRWLQRCNSSLDSEWSSVVSKL